MTLEILVGLVGMAVSLALAYVPGLNALYGGLDKQQKAIATLAIGAVLVAGAFALSCVNIRADFACTQLGAYDALKLFFAYAVGNQVTFISAVRPFQKA